LIADSLILLRQIDDQRQQRAENDEAGEQEEIGGR